MPTSNTLTKVTGSSTSSTTSIAINRTLNIQPFVKQADPNDISVPSQCYKKHIEQFCFFGITNPMTKDCSSTGEMVAISKTHFPTLLTKKETKCKRLWYAKSKTTSSQKRTNITPDFSSVSSSNRAMKNSRLPCKSARHNKEMRLQHPWGRHDPGSFDANQDPHQSSSQRSTNKLRNKPKQ